MARVIEADALFRAPESLGVQFRLLADNQAVGDDDAAIEDHLHQARAGLPISQRGRIDTLIQGRIAVQANVQ